MNHQRSTCKKSWSNTMVGRFLQCIGFYTHREDWANTTRIWSPPKKLLGLWWCFIKTWKQWFIHLNETDFFHIVTGLFQWDILASYLIIIYLDFVIQTSIHLIKKWLYTKRKTNIQYPVETITDRLCKWSNTSCKYTCSSQIPTA